MSNNIESFEEKVSYFFSDKYKSLLDLENPFNSVMQVAKQAGQKLKAAHKRIAELEGQNAELKEFRDKHLFISDHMKRPKKQHVERRDDMSQTGKLQLYWQDDGDVIIGVSKFDESGPEEGLISVEFCALSAGGGRSEYTLNALLNLMVAIEKDNERRPINED